MLFALGMGYTSQCLVMTFISSLSLEMDEIYVNIIQVHFVEYK